MKKLVLALALLLAAAAAPPSAWAYCSYGGVGPSLKRCPWLSPVSNVCFGALGLAFNNPCNSQYIPVVF